MRFEARELKGYGEPVQPDQLRVGEVCFAVQYLDDDGLVPMMTTLVFTGWNLDERRDIAFFQDAGSFAAGARYPTEQAEFLGQPKDQLNFIFNYEHALELLMGCSLRRIKAGLS